MIRKSISILLISTSACAAMDNYEWNTDQYQRPILNVKLDNDVDNENWEMVPNYNGEEIEIEENPDVLIKLKAFGNMTGKFFTGIGVGLVKHVEKQIELNTQRSLERSRRQFDQGLDSVSTIFGMGTGVVNQFNYEVEEERKKQKRNNG